ncbi:MAG: acetone carboxylase subunit gamma [Xanthobacteraceae bacterium]
MKKRISETLFVEGGKICCTSCSHPLAPAGTGWKKAAALSTVPVRTLPGTGSNVEPRVVLRRFACPQCGHLLDTETALPEDPFLEDVVAA